MRDRPDAARLLAQARATLLSELLEALPGDRRYTALMVANVLAIAEREIESGAAVAREEAASLARVFPDTSQRPPAEKEAELARQIRAGERDASSAVHELLFESCVRRLRVTNPKHLTREGIEP